MEREHLPPILSEVNAGALFRDTVSPRVPVRRGLSFCSAPWVYFKRGGQGAQVAIVKRGVCGSSGLNSMLCTLLCSGYALYRLSLAPSVGPAACLEDVIESLVKLSRRPDDGGKVMFVSLFSRWATECGVANPYCGQKMK